MEESPFLESLLSQSQSIPGFLDGRLTKFIKIEDNLNIFQNGRRPQFFLKWKTTSIFWKKENDQNIFSSFY